MRASQLSLLGMAPGVEALTAELCEEREETWSIERRAPIQPPIHQGVVIETTRDRMRLNRLRRELFVQVFGLYQPRAEASGYGSPWVPEDCQETQSRLPSKHLEHIPTTLPQLDNPGERTAHDQ